ncbi:MAG: hypothetical protein C0478_18555 [Planctomyces sp.]|jgi:hypothetical protein|nr:hypothetical protein [Planctomyces sp.]
MAWFEFFWTPDIEEHLAEHDVTPEDFEFVVCHPSRREPSRSSDRIVAQGYDPTGRWLACVYELVDRTTVIPVTAYEPERQ